MSEYLIVKGVIVSVAAIGFYLVATKYGLVLFEKYSQPILYIGTALFLAFSVFEYPLSHIEIPVLSKVIAYAYAALPFLEILTICAMATCLKEVLSGSFSIKNTALIVVSTLLTALLDKGLKTVIVVLLLYTLISRAKKKENGRKVALIIISVLTAGLFLYLTYEWITELMFLISQWNETGYMTLTSRTVWSSAKWFGTMDNLKLVGGSTTYFSILWMVGFLGIIPSVLIVLVLVYLITCLLKTRGKINASNPIILLASIYISVRVLFAVFTNCGIFFTGFMTPMPLIMDTVAGTLGIYWLLGACNSAKSK